MTARHFGLTSQRDIGRGAFDHPAGSRGAKKKYNHRTEIIYLPSGSIAQIPRFESPDFSQPGFNKPLLFALIANFLVLGLLVVAGRWLLSVLF